MCPILSIGGAAVGPEVSAFGCRGGVHAESEPLSSWSFPLLFNTGLAQAAVYPSLPSNVDAIDVDISMQ